MLRQSSGSPQSGGKTLSLALAALRLALAALLGLTATIALAGPDFDLSRYRGKVIVVDFWASWCVPCRHSVPWLNAMQAKYGERGLVVIGINVDRERAEAERFLREVPAQFEILYDPDGALAKSYDLLGMPSSFVFDRGGNLVAKHLGFQLAKRESREAEMRKILESKE